MSSEREVEGKGALVTMLIYGAIFAALWFAIYAITLGRGIVG
ncbi:MAG: cytochrome c oxidase subunit 2A [Pyrobaculum sp.]